MIEAALQMHQAFLGHSEFLSVFADDVMRRAIALVMAKAVAGALDRLPGLLEFMVPMLDPQHVRAIDAFSARRRCPRYNVRRCDQRYCY